MTVQVGDVERLIQLAGEASPEPWNWDKDRLQMQAGEIGEHLVFEDEGYDYTMSNPDADTAFIVAARSLALPLAQDWLRLKKVEEAARRLGVINTADTDAWTAVADSDLKALRAALAVGVETEEEDGNAT